MEHDNRLDIIPKKINSGASHDRLRDESELASKIDTWLEYWSTLYPDNKTVQEKLDHIDATVWLAQEIDIAPEKKESLKLGVKWHDIGRFWQYQYIGSFDDRIVHHQDIGGEFFDRLQQSGEVPNGGAADIIATSIKYHGRNTDELGLSPEQQEFVDLITAIDRIQNSCMGAVNYLEREKSEDSKHYAWNMKMSYPNLTDEQVADEMKRVSPDVWENYQNQAVFDKIKLCNTYADYFLFAIVLGLECLNSSDERVANLAKKAYLVRDEEGRSVLDKYENIINQHVDQTHSQEAIDILKEALAKIN